jgi:aspartate racemase
MTKHIGIVGVSPEGAALCYRTVCLEAGTALGRHAHPEVTMHAYPLADYMRHIEVGDWDAVADLLLSSAVKLQRSGAELLVCPANTVHQAVDLIRDRSPVPWLHIAEEVAAVIAERRFKRVLVLGTRYLMESPVYPAKLAQRGIQHEIPRREDRERINALTFDELVYGEFKESTRSYFKSVIAEGQQHGCDAAVLGCTEFPLLISEADSVLPILDSTRILARAALREAAG